MYSPWGACKVEFKHATVERGPSASSRGGKCCVRFCANEKPINHFTALPADDTPSVVAPTDGAPPPPDGAPPLPTDGAPLPMDGTPPPTEDTPSESEEKNDTNKNTIVLNCGGVPCTFKVMVYKRWY